MPHHDTIAGGTLLAFCAFVYWLTTGFSEPPSMLSQNIPPTFFPRLVLFVIAGLSIGLMASGLCKSRVKLAPPKAIVWLTAAVIVLATWLVGVLGTLLTLALVAAFLPYCWGERRWYLVGALALGLPAAIYVIFSMLLNVRFPVGSAIAPYL